MRENMTLKKKTVMSGGAVGASGRESEAQRLFFSLHATLLLPIGRSTRNLFGASHFPLFVQP